MSGRFFLFLFLMAVLTTAATFFYTTETQEILKDPGLADLDRRAIVHGWPWGYYAEVTELSRWGNGYIAWFEYGQVRPEMMFQTLLLWFIVWMVVVVVVIIASSPRQRRF